MELARALEDLGEALLKQDASAIEDAARRANVALQSLGKNSLDRREAERLTALNRRNGALLAARQAGLHWALSRLAPPSRTYGSDGQQSLAPTPRTLGAA